MVRRRLEPLSRQPLWPYGYLSHHGVRLWPYGSDPVMDKGTADTATPLASLALRQPCLRGQNSSLSSPHRCWRLLLLPLISDRPSWRPFRLPLQWSLRPMRPLCLRSSAGHAAGGIPSGNQGGHQRCSTAAAGPSGAPRGRRPRCPPAPAPAPAPGQLPTPLGRCFHRNPGPVPRGAVQVHGRPL